MKNKTVGVDVINNFIKGIGAVVFFGCIALWLLMALTAKADLVTGIAIGLPIAPFALAGALLAIIGEMGENVAALRKTAQRQTEILERLSTSRTPSPSETKPN
jgi:formate/nitrite transporter FocA (FNT family)